MSQQDALRSLTAKLGTLTLTDDERWLLDGMVASEQRRAQADDGNLSDKDLGQVAGGMRKQSLGTARSGYPMWCCA